ncbi:MAG: Imm39 family immunity protein [Pseudomonadota bacterium]
MTEVARPPHDRKLTIGLSIGYPSSGIPSRFSWLAMEAVNEELEPLFVDTGFLTDAPFFWVTIIIYVVPEKPRGARCYPINKKYGDLPLEIELDGTDLRGKSTEELTCYFRAAALNTLIHAGKKYGKPIEVLERLLAAQ